MKVEGNPKSKTEKYAGQQRGGWTLTENGIFEYNIITELRVNVVENVKKVLKCRLFKRSHYFSLLPT